MRRGNVGIGEDSEVKASEAVLEIDAPLDGPAFQVIVLGSGGGPTEDNVTALLVRSTATQWSKASILAVDAGVHLSAITRILEQHMSSAVPIATPITPIAKRRWRMNSHRASLNQLPGYFNTPERHDNGNRTSSPGRIPEDSRAFAITTGPFADLLVPHESAKANASWILRNLISTYLITHPHLDHLSGFVINTASFQHTSRPKKLAALPGTIEAIKTHLFNDVIWPNLSDEENGVGLVSYQRLVEGGNVALGEGEAKGYIEICEGLSVKAWTVSHGHCTKRHTHRSSSQDYRSDRRNSRSTVSPSGIDRRISHAHVDSKAHLPANVCISDSSAYFIRDEESGHEVLIFGDVEPDSISLAPRTMRVWADAAPKIVAGLLSGIFIECSYDDSQSDETLFGHLNPRHLIAELTTLAAKVSAVRRGEDPRASPQASSSPAGLTHSTSASTSAPSRRHRTTTPPSSLVEQSRKRKRLSNGLAIASDPDARTRRGRASQRALRPTLARGTGSIIPSVSPLSHSMAYDSTSEPSPGADGHESTTPASRNDEGTSADATVLPLEMEMDPAQQTRAESTMDGAVEWHCGAPLAGLRVVVMHVKDTLRDGPSPGETILAQLKEREATTGLGCEFLLSTVGESIWL